MFAGFSTIAIAALLLAAQTSTVTSTLTQEDYNNICLLTSTSELISTGDSCSNYYQCQNGVAVLQTCPPGLSFSKDTQSCLPASSVKCGQVVVKPCNNDNIGKWASVAGSCAGFYYCSATGAIRGNCPSGENFNPQTQSCEYASIYPCAIIETPNNGNPDSVESGENSAETSGVNLCTFMPNNVYFGSASSCQDWNICKNNVLSTGSCPSGYNFNPAIGKCDYASNVNCVQVSHDPDLIDSPQIGGVCTQQQVGLNRSATQCNAFYYCNGANYVLSYCGSGLFYDTKTSQCVPRLNAYNNCDRCVGSALTFVNAPSTTSCTGYLYCVNGVEKSSGSCATGQYFDEMVGACVVGTQPLYGCCNPNYLKDNTSGINGPPGPNGSSSGSSTSGDTANSGDNTSGAATGGNTAGAATK